MTARISIGGLADMDVAPWLVMASDGAERAVGSSGDFRNHSVGCIRCGHKTWALDAICDRCHDRMAEVER